MKRRGHNTIFASSGGVLAEEIKKEFRHIDIPTLAVNKRDLISTIKNIIKIRKILREENIDIIHGHNAAAAFTAYLASKTINRKVAITIVSEEWKSGKAISGGTLYTDLSRHFFCRVRFYQTNAD